MSGTISAATNLGAMSARRFLEMNSAGQIKATESLASGSRVSNPAYAPAEAAIGDILSAKIRSMGQASRTVSQAISIIQMGAAALSSSNRVLERMLELSSQANSDSVDNSQRTMLDGELQQLLNQIDTNATTCRLGEVSLFTGGAGTVTAATTAVAAPTMVTGATITANTFTGFTAGSSQGFITGVAQDFSVTQNGTQYIYQMQVGDQVFKGATTTTLATSQVISLTSITDSNNVISFTTDASDVTGLSSASTIQAAGRAMLGIETGQNAVFTSKTNVTGTAYANMTIAAGAGVEPGAYGLTYTKVGTVGTFTLSNGLNSYSQTCSETADNSMSETVTFSNGLTLTLAAFDGSASITQTTFSVAQGSSVSLSFQIADHVTDTVSMTFTGATSSALGLSGISIATRTAAANAYSKITSAQSLIQSQNATLGGKKSQLDFQADNLKVAMINNAAMKSSFVDTNMTEALMDSTKFRALTDMASTVFTQALSEPSRISRMVQQAGQA